MISKKEREIILIANQNLVSQNLRGDSFSLCSA